MTTTNQFCLLFFQFFMYIIDTNLYKLVIFIKCFKAVIEFVIYLRTGWFGSWSKMFIEELIEERPKEKINWGGKLLKPQLLRK